MGALRLRPLVTAWELAFSFAHGPAGGGGLDFMEAAFIGIVDCEDGDGVRPVEGEALDEIREIFRNHPSNEVSSEALQMGEIDVAGLKQFLQIDRQFSQRRMDNAMEKLTQAGLIRESGQTSLFSF